MPRKVKFARQPRIAGVRRVPAVGSFHPDVEAAIERLQKQYAVSRSWVIAFYVEIGMFGHASAEHVEDFGGIEPFRERKPLLRRVK